MDVNTLIQLVSSLGFPIVCCGALFWKLVKTDEQHKEEMYKVTEALNNNTIALTKLSDKLGEGIIK
nr:MAG TPA: YvrJ protein family protein [Caudoviricetes sp.]